MLYNMTTVLFLLRKTKAKQARHILYCRVTVNELTQEFSTEEPVNKEHWDQRRQLHKADNEEGKYINTLTAKITYRIKSIALKLEDFVCLTPDELIHRYKNPDYKIEKNPLLPDLVRQYILDAEGNRLDHALKPPTISKYRQYEANLLKFLIHTRQKGFTQSVTLTWAEDFKGYVTKTNGLTHRRYISRHVEFFIKVMEYNIRLGNMDKHNLVYYKGTHDPGRTPHMLNRAQLMQFVTAQFQTKAIQEVRDLFLFQVGTGVSYVDIYNTYTVLENENGTKLLQSTRTKSGVQYYAVLEDVVEVILNKYSFKLPYYPLATYNALLKEAIALAGITTPAPISTKWARVIFTNMKDWEGWSTKTLCRMLGHKNERTTEKYYLINSPNRVFNEVEQRRKLL